jgi:hypothetical protein
MSRQPKLMFRFGMKPLAALQADMIEGARLLGWPSQIGQLKPGNPAQQHLRSRARKFCHEKRRDRSPVNESHAWKALYSANELVRREAGVSTPA